MQPISAPGRKPLACGSCASSSSDSARIGLGEAMIDRRTRWTRLIQHPAAFRPFPH